MLNAFETGCDCVASFDVERLDLWYLWLRTTVTSVVVCHRTSDNNEQVMMAWFEDVVGSCSFFRVFILAS